MEPIHFQPHCLCGLLFTFQTGCLCNFCSSVGPCLATWLFLLLFLCMLCFGFQTCFLYSSPTGYSGLLQPFLVSNMCLLRPHRRRLVSDSSVAASVKRLRPEEFSPVLIGRAISKANPCLRSWNRAIRNRFSLSATWLIASGGASAPIHRWVWWRRPGGLQLGPQFGPERGHRGSGRCPTLCAAILFVQRLEMSPKPWADVLNRELRYGLGKGNILKALLASVRPGSGVFSKKKPSGSDHGGSGSSTAFCETKLPQARLGYQGRLECQGRRLDSASPSSLSSAPPMEPLHFEPRC